MARASTTSDVFNAIAEPKRREIVAALAKRGPQSVGELVEALNLPQPAVSKHLAVMRAVDLVSVKKKGKSRVYMVNPPALQTVHEWTRQFEELWSNQLERIKQPAERKAKEQSPSN